MANTTLVVVEPETFRLPKHKSNDQHFGLTRNFYYQGEKAGYWKLIRILTPGKKKGVTLVPFAEVKAFLRKRAKANGAQ